jgi:hypothetical protein
MAESYYRIGEQRGPFEVTESTFEILPNGRTVEYVKDSGGNSAITYGWDDDREYYQVCERTHNDSVLVPFTKRHPLTESGVPSHASWVYVGSDRCDYWRVLYDWWKPRDFTIIEHDVRATPEVFEEFAVCPHRWCTFRYSNHSDEDHEAWKNGILGCTRFRSELIHDVPWALRELEWRYRDWHVMSTGLGMTLRDKGFTPHLHGVVDHHRMMDQGGVTVLMGAA